MVTMNDLFDGSDAHKLPPDRNSDADGWHRTNVRSHAYLCGLDSTVVLAVSGNNRWHVRLWHSGDLHDAPTDYATREEGEAAAVAMVMDMAREFVRRNEGD